MTPWSDLEDEMRRRPLDHDTADRLLSGRIEPDDAPPGYAEVASMLRAVAAPATSEELAGEPETVAAVARTVRIQHESSLAPATRRSPVRGRFFRAKVAGLVVAGTLVGSTGLAFAGVLPDAAQNAAATVLSKVGITIPAANDHPASTGSEISSIATTTSSPGVAKGAEISSSASDGMSQAGQHGSAGAQAPSPVATPNPGGTGTGDAASGGASDSGTATANDASQGHSSAGSANATVTPSTLPTPGSAP
jgi:hypothetical protein